MRARFTPLVVFGLVSALVACQSTVVPAGSGRSEATPSAPAASVATSTPIAPSGVFQPPKAPDGRMPVVEHGARTGNLVALTFDSDMTEAMRQRLLDREVASYDGDGVVDVLTASRTPATFFITGMWAEVYPDTARRMGTDPLFEVGSHSYSHGGFATPCYTLEPVPVDQMVFDLRKSYESITKVVPNPLPYFRFPGGCHDDQALATLGPLNLTAIQWDVISGDAFGTDPEAIVRASVDRARPGSIIVLHSTLGTAPLTPKVLPRIIEALRAKGLTPVRLSELLAAR